MRGGHPEILQICPTASSAVLDRGLHTDRAAEWKNMLPVGPPFPPNIALGMYCNLAECQKALLSGM